MGFVSTGVDMAYPAFAGIEFVFKDFSGEGDSDPHE